MTDNMKILIDQVTTAINSEYGDSLPTLEQINDKADKQKELSMIGKKLLVRL